jgi:hypothetical protein
VCDADALRNCVLSPVFAAAAAQHPVPVRWRHDGGVAMEDVRSSAAAARRWDDVDGGVSSGVVQQGEQ